MQDGGINILSYLFCGGVIMHLLNEEIRCIQNTMSHLKKWISIETDSERKESHKKRYDELEELLTKKLDGYRDFKG